MRRYVPLLIAGSALIAAACRDAVAPTRPETPETAIRQFGDRSFASAISATDVADAQTITFEIRPEGGSARIGDFTLTYDANAVCDPTTSGYGAGTWNNACETLKTPITITAKFWKADGRNYSDFSPDIRFSPSKNVILSVKRPEIVGQSLSWSMILKYGIFYTVRVGDTRFFVDEAWYDSDLLTHFDTRAGVVWRRAKHFSGYVVHTGFCDENPEDPSCQSGGGE